MESDRAGFYKEQFSNNLTYKAFIPKPLPPEPPLQFDTELTQLLSQADQAIGRLDGVIKNIPNQDLFVLMYVKKEAVLSSQIEGTQVSLADILEKEEDILAGKTDDDVKVTLNYIKALNEGLELAKKLPISLRLIKELHRILLTGTRGEARNPGEFRTSQNWIGSKNSTLATARFIPPPPEEMNQALNALEKYIHQPKAYPVLIESGLVHVQFETIHPFGDGNGRIGRLLITFILSLNNIISQPVLYLSYYLKKNRSEYYDRLIAVRNEGDWEGWLKFFLKGIIETSNNAVELTDKIGILQKKNLESVRSSMTRYSAKSIELLDKIYIHPIFSVNKAAELCGLSYNAAKSITRKFIDLKIIVEPDKKKRNQKYYFKEYIDLLVEGTELR
ncbi:MAG: Fic family protein [Planctomycetota bacterium]